MGHQSNCEAIGAAVKIQTADGARYATVTAACGYFSACDQGVHFGLAREVSIQSMEIRWPSGIVQTVKAVYGDPMLWVAEPHSELAGR
ncbi:MAG TPA: ASPIC/UnbV domain-containing protein [Candidatus Eisenbacteria bacterium]|nr:ASPIC/UnbV domain-containing protein [Candidatus Eisenbacteria bacterium]